MKTTQSSYAVADFDTPPNSPDAPMTGDQADLLKALCTEAGEPFNEGLTQIEAHRRIKELSDHLNTDQNL
ncbi:DUF3072 domain-containing protein [Yoonia sp. 208BN28-4]|uniref:DUF3072 domain-containing protein n=1 Tax=Yoonia sp. 208BN28-4 TaxID=3126505 RepID=UPI0030B68370